MWIEGKAVTRRTLLKGAAAVAAPYVISSSVLGKGGAVAPSEEQQRAAARTEPDCGALFCRQVQIRLTASARRTGGCLDR